MATGSSQQFDKTSFYFLACESTDPERYFDNVARFFTVRSWDRHNYFMTSPDKYPYEQYYDETALRYGLEFGSTMTFKDYNFAVAYRLRILDSGLIAVYNNKNRDLQYYISSGVSLQYVF